MKKERRSTIARPSAPSHKFRIPNWQNEMLSTWLHLIHLSETGKSVLSSSRQAQIRIPACQRLRQHSAYVPAPACHRHVWHASYMLASLAMAGRSLAMAGRSKLETNSNDQNLKIPKH